MSFFLSCGSHIDVLRELLGNKRLAVGPCTTRPISNEIQMLLVNYYADAYPRCSCFTHHNSGDRDPISTSSAVERRLQVILLLTVAVSRLQNHRRKRRTLSFRWNSTGKCMLVKLLTSSPITSGESKRLSLSFVFFGFADSHHT